MILRRAILPLVGLILSVDRGWLYAELVTSAADCPKAGRKVTIRFESPNGAVIERKRWWVRVLGEDMAKARGRVKVWRHWRRVQTTATTYDGSGSQQHISVLSGLWQVTVWDGDNLLAAGDYVVNERD